MASHIFANGLHGEGAHVDPLSVVILIPRSK